MATTKSSSIETPSRPLIQIDDLVREMTEEEFAAYEEQMANAPQLPEPAEA
jgi:hypothetical protein